MRRRQAPQWEAKPDGTHVAKIGRYLVTIHPPQPWMFWRGDHKGVATHVGPGESRTVSFHASTNDGMSSTAFTLEGAKINAEWHLNNPGQLHGHPVPENLKPETEKEVERLWHETVAYVNKTYGDR